MSINVSLAVDVIAIRHCNQTKSKVYAMKQIHVCPC